MKASTIKKTKGIYWTPHSRTPYLLGGFLVTATWYLLDMLHCYMFIYIVHIATWYLLFRFYVSEWNFEASICSTCWLVCLWLCLSVGMSVYLSVCVIKSLNLGHAFWTVRDKNFHIWYTSIYSTNESFSNDTSVVKASVHSFKLPCTRN